MPNGKGFPQCGECIHANRDPLSCKIHKFHMPYISYEVLCRDYMPANDYAIGPDEKIKNLEENYLFYYSYAWERFYTKLGTYSQLQHAVYGVHIIKSKEYTWVFEVREWQEKLKNKASIFITYGNNKERFNKKILKKQIQPSILKKQVDYITSFAQDENQRDLLKQSIIPATKKQCRSAVVFVSNKSGSDLIQLFLFQNVDIDKYQKAKEKVSFFEISVFLKELEDDIYELKPDLFDKTAIDILGKKTGY